MSYIQQLDCTEWQFDEVPQFTYGIMRPIFADCGTGAELDSQENTQNDSFMHTFDSVNETEIREYVCSLEKSGFKKVYENSICGNLFYQFSVPSGFLYISFLKNSGVAKFTLDRCRSVSISSFGYSDYEKECDDTVFAQYSLYYDKMIKGTTCDCGMNYVYRLRDNSLIIIDGGEMEQATDIAAADFMSFIHSLTGTAEGEKIRISLWLCTHAHNDHCDFMSKLILRYSDELEIERTAFNFPNPQNTRHSPSIEKLKQRLGRYPDARYIKPHAGCAFNIANAKIEILLSAEDALGVDEEDLFPGTNSTSMLFKVTADGVSTFFLADCGDDNGSVLVDCFDNSVLDCDFLQAAHHGINSIYDVYEKINAEKVLLPQCKMNMDTRFAENYEHMCSKYGEGNIIMANDATDIFTLKNGSISSEKRAHVGTAYDNSEW